MVHLSNWLHVTLIQNQGLHFQTQDLSFSKLGYSFSALDYEENAMYIYLPFKKSK